MKTRGEEPVGLRLYRPGDLERMYQLDNVCFDERFRFSRRAMQSFAEAPGSLTLVAENSSTIVGFCILQIEDHVGYVVTLDVAPESRRQGLATRLLSGAEDLAHRAGVTDVVLHVWVGNSEAIRFYERAGYIPSGSAPDFYGSRIDALVFRKQLDGISYS